MLKYFSIVNSQLKTFSGYEDYVDIQKSYPQKRQKIFEYAMSTLSGQNKIKFLVAFHALESSILKYKYNNLLTEKISAIARDNPVCDQSVFCSKMQLYWKNVEQLNPHAFVNPGYGIPLLEEMENALDQSRYLEKEKENQDLLQESMQSLGREQNTLLVKEVRWIIGNDQLIKDAANALMAAEF